jgi:alpha 1,2-mannosyltransferase
VLSTVYAITAIPQQDVGGLPGQTHRQRTSISVPHETMSTPYSSLPDAPADTILVNAGPRSGAKARAFRLRPVHLLLAGAALVVGLPLLAGPHGRTHVTDYFTSSSSSDLSTKHIMKPSGALPDHLGIPLTLEARLSHLLARPALDQWEQELLNRQSCPFYTYSRNTYFFHDGKPEQWEKITKDDVKKYRAKMVEYLRNVEREGGKLVWDKSMEEGIPKEERKGIILTSNEGVCNSLSLQRLRRLC